MKDRREVSTDEGMDFAKEHGCLFMETSARDDVAVTQAFEELVEVIKRVPELMESARKPAERLVEKQNVQKKHYCC